MKKIQKEHSIVFHASLVRTPNCLSHDEWRHSTQGLSLANMAHAHRYIMTSPRALIERVNNASLTDYEWILLRWDLKLQSTLKTLCYPTAILSDRLSIAQFSGNVKVGTTAQIVGRGDLKVGTFGCTSTMKAQIRWLNFIKFNSCFKDP